MISFEVFKMLVFTLMNKYLGGVAINIHDLNKKPMEINFNFTIVLPKAQSV
jgi:hypothetical protein